MYWVAPLGVMPMLTVLGAVDVAVNDGAASGPPAVSHAVTVAGTVKSSTVTGASPESDAADAPMPRLAKARQIRSTNSPPWEARSAARMASLMSTMVGPHGASFIASVTSNRTVKSAPSIAVRSIRAATPLPSLVRPCAFLTLPAPEPVAVKVGNGLDGCVRLWKRLIIASFVSQRSIDQNSPMPCTSQASGLGTVTEPVQRRP